MRYLPLTLALLAAPLLPSLAPAADNTPSLTGTWQLDMAKSQTDHNQDIKLELQDVSNKITFVRHVRERDGKEVVSHFSCMANGSQCEFDEGNHKAKGSAWRDGSTLFVLMSDGPRENSSAEWQLQVSPDGKTLNVQYNLLAPEDKMEKHVFTKVS